MERRNPPGGEGDWKLFPELPKAEEILQPKRDGSLPRNPVDKPWASKEAYLETQYKLLRCEATEGLRFSVRSFLEASVRKQDLCDDDHTWVYPEIRVRGYLMSKLGPIARIEFTTRSKYKITWQQSKRLMPGKIVALTTKADGFRTICMVATIAQRPYFGGLDQDPPQVDLMWANPEDAVLDPSAELVMVESRHGYFEATRHALVGLQLSAQNQSPLDKYLLGIHNVDTMPAFPASQQRELGDLNYEGPQLDESQNEALGRILSTELAIIQGPPGTGKTFTSVAALTALTALRRKNGGPPLVIASQTNQALDHMLVACLDAGLEIARIGGRASDVCIQEASLFNLRRRNQRLATERNQELKAVESARQQNIGEIQALVQAMFGKKLLNPRGLLSWGVITPEQYNSLELEDDTEIDPSLYDMGIFALWLGDSLIPAKILRNRHPILSDFEPAPSTEEAELEDDGEIQHIAEDDEERDRIRGTFIPLEHIWSGKEPVHYTSWINMVQRELRAPDLFAIRPEFRGAVYQHLQARFLAAVQPKFGQLLRKNILLCKRARELKSQQDAALIQRSGIDVVGCTTTGLAKYRRLLSNLNPQSLLVEEAAETIEANIVSAIYPSLRQLILVGDHQQLAPHCDVHWLKQPPYNFTVSLFQRMVNLRMPLTMLKQQRRMRPELRLIVSPFYPGLRDHPGVLMPERSADVPGMGGKNSWFFDHCWPEETNSEHSKFNEQEAQMVANFYAYLVGNGTRRITILTFYVGQRKMLVNKLRNHPSLVGLNFKVETVDSYQGKENDVVLLSLVRSPDLKSGSSIGFLEDTRRVVVAISRARRGFYMFGNVDNVLKAGPTTDNPWAKIWGVLAGQNRVNPRQGLPLTCQNHGNVTWVRDVEDWGDNAGGCNLRCSAIRPCGHPCTLRCHPSPHETLGCSQPCKKRLKCGHGCERYCGQVCACSCDEFRGSTRGSNSTEARQDVPEDELPLVHHLLKLCPGSSLLQAETAREPHHPSSPDRGILQTRNGLGGQAHQNALAQWKDFAANITLHDESLRLDHTSMAKTERVRASTTVIKETYRPTAVVEGFRVEGSEKDVATIKVPNPPLISRTTAAPPSQVVVITAEPQAIRDDGSKMSLGRLCISGTSVIDAGNSVLLPESHAQGPGRGGGEEEWMIEF